MQAVQLADRHRDELIEVGGFDERRRERAEPGLVDWQIVADDRTHHLGELLAVAQAQKVRLRATRWRE